ncbi:MAG: DUF2752 domain-containing protein [Actinobacteria bacterium ATB1]|nr:DUF2752 domain-containing protein [Actinobacteria bacterium ATB1]
MALAHTHADNEICEHRVRRDPGALALLLTGGLFFLAPCAYAAIGGPFLGGPILCGMRNFFGIPCPLCGMTTSFTFSARGQVDDAFRAAPLGPLLWLLALAAAVYGAFLLRSQRPLELTALPRPVHTVLVRWWVWLPALIVFAWIWQVLRINVWGWYV